MKVFCQEKIINKALEMKKRDLISIKVSLDKIKDQMILPKIEKHSVMVTKAAKTEVKPLKDDSSQKDIIVTVAQVLKERHDNPY